MKPISIGLTAIKKFIACAAVIAVVCIVSPSYAQTTVSGTKVQNGTGTGTLLSSGTWCFASNCLTVTSGAFSGTVTPSTQNITVVNSSSVTILTIQNVTIGSSAFSFDTYVVSSGTPISGTGTPTIACGPGAQFYQTDASNLLWTCVSVSPGVATWQRGSGGGQSYPINPASVVASETALTSSATPSFGNLTNAQYMILNQNVTSWSVSPGLPGQSGIITFCENGTGGYTLSGTPSNVKNWPGLISTSSGSCTAVPVTYNSSAAAWIAPPSSGGGSGFPITLGTTSIASGSSTTSVAGLTVNGVSLASTGSATNFLNATGAYSTPSGGVSTVFTRTGAVVAASGDYTVSQVTGAAPIASPTFTGTATIPTLDLSGITGSTQCLHANSSGTVSGAGADCGSGGSVSSVFTRTGAVVAASGDYTVSQVTGAAPLASPALTGTPTAPTATVGTNTTQVATTAFVLANAGGISGGTINFIPKYGTGGTSILNSLLDDGSTTANTLSYGGAGGIAATAGPIVSTPPAGDAGQFGLAGNTALQSLLAGNFNLIGPASGSVTAYGWQVPTAVNGSAGIMHVGAPTAARSQLSVSQVSLTTDVSGILPVANGGNGTASPALTAGSNVTITGSWPGYTINATSGGLPSSTASQTYFNNAGTPGPTSAIQESSASTTGVVAFSGAESHFGTGPTTSTTTTGTTSSAATSITVSSTTGYPTCTAQTPCYFVLGSNNGNGEIISATGSTGTTFTGLTRSLFTTSAATSLASGAYVDVISNLRYSNFTTAPFELEIWNGGIYITPDTNFLATPGSSLNGRLGFFVGTHSLFLDSGLAFLNNGVWDGFAGGIAMSSLGAFQISWDENGVPGMSSGTLAVTTGTTTIAPVNAVTTFTGSSPTALATITVPADATCTLTAAYACHLVFIGVGMTTVTSGNIANVIVTTANVPVDAYWLEGAAKWYLK